MGLRIPSIDVLLRRPGVTGWVETHGRAPVVAALRGAADDVRARLGHAGAPATQAALDAAVIDGAGARLAARGVSTLRRVINATGVVLHTNLGRAPIAAAAIDRLRELTGAEAAVAVNNNAAAALLVLTALAAGREVIVSRGELVEIGGGFRVPDVMAQSGAMLREVGTTNKTRAADYAAAISGRTALILRVHPSNFRIEGFTARPPPAELAAAARQFSLPLYEDLGSGLLARDARFPAEPSVRDSLESGADLVSFSGDKLLGGPQAGIVAGRGALVDRVRRHPLMRALRVDKLTYAALEATLQAHAAGRAETDVPIWRMIALSIDEIDARAAAVAASLPTSFGVELIDGQSAIGGGSAPDVELPTRLIALTRSGMPADDLAARLRAGSPPIVARIQDGRVLLDLRTVAPEDDATVVEGVRGMG